jgi:O-antigen/teichoic acid export membrane protein
MPGASSPRTRFGARAGQRGSLKGAQGARTAFRSILAGALGQREAAAADAGRARERMRRIAWTSVASFGAKGISVLTTVIAVALTVSYLGPERYGMWMTISTVVLFLSFADLGVGNGLLNAVSDAQGREDRVGAQRAVSSAFALLSAVGVALVCVFALSYRWVDWGRAFNLSSELAVAEAPVTMFVLVSCFSVGLPLSIVQRIQWGFQEGFASTLWGAFGSLIGVAMLVVAVKARLGLPYLVFCISGGPLLATVLNATWQFGWVRPWLRPRLRYASFGMARKLMVAGAYFTVLGVMTILGTQSDPIFITHAVGPEASAAYSITQKLFAMTMVASFFVAPLWPALSEAISRGDVAWAKGAFQRFVRVAVLTGVVTGGGLVFCGRWVVELWVGSALVPSRSLLVAMALWTVLASYAGTVAALLNTSRLLRSQVALYTGASLFALALKYPLVVGLGQTGAAAATVIAYGAVYAWPAGRLVRRFFATA